MYEKRKRICKEQHINMIKLRSMFLVFVVITYNYYIPAAFRLIFSKFNSDIDQPVFPF